MHLPPSLGALKKHVVYRGPLPHIVMNTIAIPEATRTRLHSEIASFDSPDAFIKDAMWQTTMTCEGVTVHVFHKNNEIPVFHIQRVIRRIVRLFHILGMTTITYWLIPGPSLKGFPTDGEVGKTHVNSGYTYTNGNNIFIYRREEFPKVMLHEAIHHSLLDTGRSWSQNDLLRIFSKFGISHHTLLRPNEAVVETWAELFHLAFISHEYGWDLRQLYETELKWSLQQTRRILKKQGRAAWKEGTHAFSYYVIRSLFLFKPEAFMRTSDQARNAGTPVYVDLIMKIADSPEYKAALQGVRTPKHDCFRMTVYGDL